jgi:type IV pilus assembly protein PilA
VIDQGIIHEHGHGFFKFSLTVTKRTLRQDEEENMFRKMNRKDEKGFTLIELMIVIAIIGILAAIAIPQFSAYRNRAFNAAALSDLKNAVTAQEAYFVDFQVYGGATGDNITPTSSNILQTRYGVEISKGVTLTLTAITATTYNMRAVNSLAGAQANTYDILGPGGQIVATTP